MLSDDATEDIVCIYARAYIMMLLSTQLFGDKSGNRVHIRCLPFVARLDEMGSPLQLLQFWIFWRFPSLRPWGFDAFSFLLGSRWVTYLPTFDRKEERVIQCRLSLDRLGDRDIVWEPYASLDVLAVVHPEILAKEHSRLWRAYCA
ncbi:hypothetical protein Ahy_A03g012905 [Arachis hypogaea]|uniref:Aminotransferase-like plant mobile domain-containing protein n=1 Tax=Arachis hypogaea TaxID=3818 RepID=A0A445DUE9_ARAHY|nr:hypothetical protein Ahy_A03g012905 [Arachis hypogaea]